jgi:hypothetical protein
MHSRGCIIISILISLFHLIFLSISSLYLSFRFSLFSPFIGNQLALRVQSASLEVTNVISFVIRQLLLSFSLSNAYQALTYLYWNSNTGYALANYHCVYQVLLVVFDRIVLRYASGNAHHQSLWICDGKTRCKCCANLVCSLHKARTKPAKRYIYKDTV